MITIVIEGLADCLDLALGRILWSMERPCGRQSDLLPVRTVHVYTATQKSSRGRDWHHLVAEVQSFHGSINADARAVDEALPHVRSEDAEDRWPTSTRSLIQKGSGGFTTHNTTHNTMVKQCFRRRSVGSRYSTTVCSVAAQRHHRDRASVARVSARRRCVDRAQRREHFERVPVTRSASRFAVPNVYRTGCERLDTGRNNINIIIRNGGFGAKMGLDTRGQNLRNNGFCGGVCWAGRVPGRAWGRGTGMLIAGPGPAAGHIRGATPQGGSAHRCRSAMNAEPPTREAGA